MPKIPTKKKATKRKKVTPRKVKKAALEPIRQYRIQFLQGKRWKYLTPRPHGEIYPYDKKGLYFDGLTAAIRAYCLFRDANVGTFRITDMDGSYPATPEFEL